MRPISSLTVFGGAALAALAATGAGAASSDYYLHLGDVKGGLAANAGSGKTIEILSWSWGAAMADEGGAPSAGKYGAVSGAHRDDTLNAAPGAPAEKRQHGWVTVSQPLDRGAVRVKVKFPWLECKVGAAFPDAVLQNDAGRYEFEDAIITGCAPDAVSLNYTKVQVRGWDPEKK